MDNRVCNIFSKNKILLKDLQTLDFAEFSKKRSYQLFFGVDSKNFFTLVFFRDARSKFLNKELEELKKISAMVMKKFDTNIVKFILIYNSQICSKVLKTNKEWKFYDFV